MSCTLTRQQTDDLARRACRGDVAARNALAESHLRLAMWAAGDDDEHQSIALVVLVQVAARWNPELATGSFTTYVTKSIRNAIFRARSSRRREVQDQAAEFAEDRFDVEEYLNRRADSAAARKRVQRALEQIPSFEAEVLRLRFGLGCEPVTLRETARQLGCSLGWAHESERRGLESMRAALCGALTGRRSETAVA